MELYLIRHGLTDWNAQERLQGRTNIPINEAGRQAAGDLGIKLDTVFFNTIYSSPLDRAYETATLIRGHRNIPIIRDDRLIEVSFGAMEGKNFQELKASEGPYRYFFNSPELYEPADDGESLNDLCKRTQEFIQEVVEPQYGKAQRLMVVAHGALNKSIMKYLLHREMKDFWGGARQRNCEAAIFSYDGTTWTFKGPKPENV